MSEDITTSQKAPSTTQQPAAIQPVQGTPMSANLLVPDLPTWTADDYAEAITGSGAHKLADSGVAPLVAAARGYERIDSSNFTEKMKQMKVQLANKQGRRFRRTLNEPMRDGMQMPWYSAADIQIANRTPGTSVVPFTYQVRPSHPEDNEHGKPIKYEFLPNIGTPLDIHPATPVDWLDNTPVVMFTEGMLKGDSALSAYLHSLGNSYDELSLEGVTDPASKMRAMMEAVPVEQRILIISIAGIYNTTQNPVDWREIKLKGREGWIAFDADLTENRFVYQAAAELHRRLDEKCKMSAVKFLSPQVISGDDGSMAKAGVDDFLAKSGTWSQLVASQTSKLPEPPKYSADEEVGNWRIHNSGLYAEECFAINQGPGGAVSGFGWKKALDLGGRIVALESRRQPTDQEIRTGLLSKKLSAHDIVSTNVEIEVSWEEAGTSRTATVTGPETILAYPPSEWDRRGATTPSELLRHRSWPPRGAKGESWLAAMKAHRSEETAVKTRWMQMGWVPVDGGDPVFLIGDQVIGDPESTSTAVAGIDDRELDTVDSFGVGTDISGEWGNEDYHELVRQDLKAVIATYIDARPWTDETTAALVLAGALRPTLPIRPRSTTYWWGPKGGGKSWTAKCQMYFWERNPEDWKEKLPGSAKDSMAFLEMKVSQAPIWVVDDLAPSTSKRQAEAETAKLEDLTRNIFNNASRGRMNADMTTKKSNKPISQLIITAENELTTPSAKERLVPAYIGRGKLHPSQSVTEDVDLLAHEEGVPARLTAHILKFIRYRAAKIDGGWEAYVTSLRDGRKAQQEIAKQIMKNLGAPKGSLERTTSLAADLMVTYTVLEDMAEYLRMDYDFVSRLTVEQGGLAYRLVELVHNSHTENQNFSPGRSLVRALSALLATGGAHVVAAEDPSRPPILSQSVGDSLLNSRLGWLPGSSKGEFRPGGPTIGTVISMKDEEENSHDVIMFDVEAAFSKAQDAYPHLIGFGQGSAAAWSAIWDEEISPKFVNREKNSRGTGYLNTKRVRIGANGLGVNRISGVPIEVSAIIGGAITLDEMANDTINDMAA